MKHLKQIYEETKYNHSVFENSLSVLYQLLKDSTFEYKDNLVKVLDLNFEYSIISVTYYDKRRDEVIEEFKFTMDINEFLNKAKLVEEN